MARDLPPASVLKAYYADDNTLLFHSPKFNEIINVLERENFMWFVSTCFI